MAHIQTRPGIPHAASYYHTHAHSRRERERGSDRTGKMPVMDKLKMFVVQEPVVAASCLIAGVGLFLPAVVRPILDSYGTSSEPPKTCMSDIVATMIEKKR